MVIKLAIDFIQESIGSYRFLEDQINGYHDDVKYQKTGRLVLAHSKKKLEALKAKNKFIKFFNQSQIGIFRDVNHEISNDYYKGGMLVHDAASIHPGLFYKFLLNQSLTSQS
jgi:hypothetical protein